MQMQRFVLACALSIAATGAAWSQQYRGTAEQQMACTPDVWRLCSDQVPDVNRIVACLQQNAPRLSPGCRAAFQTGPAPRPAGPNGRIVRSPPYPQPAPYPQPPYAM